MTSAFATSLVQVRQLVFFDSLLLIIYALEWYIYNEYCWLIDLNDYVVWSSSMMPSAAMHFWIQNVCNRLYFLYFLPSLHLLNLFWTHFGYIIVHPFYVFSVIISMAIFYCDHTNVGVSWCWCQTFSSIFLPCWWSAFEYKKKSSNQLSRNREFN